MQDALSMCKYYPFPPAKEVVLLPCFAFGLLLFRYFSLAVVMCEPKVPLIKRFSGGGTVIVDGSTIFASLIMNQVGVGCVIVTWRVAVPW